MNDAGGEFNRNEGTRTMASRITTTLTLALLLAGGALAQPIVATDWQSVTTSTAQGALGGVTVEVSDVGVPSLGPVIAVWDLSLPVYDPYGLSASQEVLDYSFDQNWTATFGSPVANLMLYCRAWRGANNGSIDPPTFDYEFDQPFTILTGFDDAIVSGNTLQLPSDVFHDGILLFPGPVTSVSVLSNNANSSSRQLLTFAVEGEPVATEQATWGAVKGLFR